jgi:hypothetical protein
MLALAIPTLFTITAILALLTIADSLLKARAAHAALVREGALLRTGFAVQVEARELRVRQMRARLAVRPDRRMAPLRPHRAFPACAAA